MKVKSICIVGGGSAGWMTAVSLARNCPSIKVSIVESSEIPTIGVGEATQPYVSTFFKEYLGMEEHQWMKECNATYKAALRFSKFNDNVPEDVVYHTFWSEQEAQNSVYNWGVRKFVNQSIPNSNYTRTFYRAHSMCESNKFDPREGEGFEYAHHLDASKFGTYCKKLAGDYPIELIEGTVSEVSTYKGDIVKLQLGSGQVIEADLFVDCTGFKALLIEGALNEPIKDTNSSLINDRAVAVRVPYTNKEEELNVYTNCTALSSGWTWNVPLWNQRGCGYVYSSRFLSDKDAIAELQEHIREVLKTEPPEDSQFRVVPMRTGSRERSWKGNCVSIGLSSQFLEPLESTGLVFVVNQIKSLISSLAGEYPTYNELSRTLYNYESEKLFEEARLFVVLHYLNTSRSDTPYWRYLQTQEVPSDLVALISNIINLDNWDVGYNKMFNQKSWEHILLGFGVIDFSKNLNIGGEALDMDKHLENVTEIIQYLKNLEINNVRETYSLPSHYQYLKDNIYDSDN